jgi:hypothetical protein
MKTIIVYPHRGIDNINFGMTRNKVEQIISPKHSGEQSINDGIYIQYSDYHITYKDNVVTEIYFTKQDDFIVLLNNIDLFHTKAEEIFDAYKRISEYDCDCEDEYLSWTFYFKDLGMSLWRESAYHPKLLNEKWFQELIDQQEENLEYEQRFWYFNQICLMNSVIDKPMKRIKHHSEPIMTSPTIKTPTQEDLEKIKLKYKLL